MSSSSITSLLCSWGIFRWQDIVEIVFFSALVYLISRWLMLHTSKKLLVIFYAYCSCISIAYFLDLATAQHVLITAAPVAAMLIILMHQQMIQKNFIVAQRIVTNPNNQSWVEALTQSCLTYSSENRDLYGIIQRNDDISSYLTTTCAINTAIHKDLLLMVLQSAHFSKDQFLWLRSTGNLVGINCTMTPLQSTIIPDAHNPLLCWQQSAVALTAKTDAFVFKRDHITNSFSIIVNGSIAEKITAQQFVTMVYDYCSGSSFSQREPIHDQKKSSTRPPTPHA